MNELDVVRRVKDRLLTQVPTDTKHAVEVVITRMEEEASFRQDILDCAMCPLAEACTNKVPGIGPTDASIMMIAESPGEHEDKEGIPFVGKGGDMLNRAIESIGWHRDDLYITNMLKCRPPGNRNPAQQEIASCFKHLKKEIELVKPKVIIAVGSLAANTLLHPEFKITQENGHWFELSERTRGISIYHPSYLLRLGEGTQRQNQAKWEVYHALKKVKDYQENDFSDEYG